MKPTFVILAAGLGTRMRSKRAKVLHRAGGLALVEHVVRSARGVTDADRIVVVLGHQADEVKAVLAPYGVASPSRRSSGEPATPSQAPAKRAATTRVRWWSLTAILRC